MFSGVRDDPKKNAALIWVFSKPGPTPPPGFLELLGHFSVGSFFWGELFGHFLCHNSPKIRETSGQKLLDFVKPPPFSNQNSKIVGAQKVPQNFWISSKPPPLMENTIIKAAFFLRSPLNWTSCRHLHVMRVLKGTTEHSLDRVIKSHGPTQPNSNPVQWIEN